MQFLFSFGTLTVKAVDHQENQQIARDLIQPMPKLQTRIEWAFTQPHRLKEVWGGKG
jgi:hypothetical protein